MIRPPATPAVRPKSARRDYPVSAPHGDLPTVVPHRELSRALGVSNRDSYTPSSPHANILSAAIADLQSGVCQVVREELREEVSFLKYHLEDRIKPVLDIVSLTSSRMALFSEGFRGLKADMSSVQENVQNLKENVQNLKAELPSQDTLQDISKFVKGLDADCGEILDILKEDRDTLEEALSNLRMALPSADAVDSILTEVKRSSSHMEDVLCSFKQELPNAHPVDSILAEVEDAKSQAEEIFLKLVLGPTGVPGGEDMKRSVVSAQMEHSAQPTRGDLPEQNVVAASAAQVEKLPGKNDVAASEAQVIYTMQETLQAELRDHFHFLRWRLGDMAAPLDRVHDLRESSAVASKHCEFPAPPPPPPPPPEFNGRGASDALQPVDCNSLNSLEDNALRVSTSPVSADGNMSHSFEDYTSQISETECSSKANPPIPLQTPESPVSQAQVVAATIQSSPAALGTIKPPDFRGSKSLNEIGQEKLPEPPIAARILPPKQPSDPSTSPSSALRPPDLMQMLKSADDLAPQSSETNEIGQEKLPEPPIAARILPPKQPSEPFAQNTLEPIDTPRASSGVVPRPLETSNGLGLGSPPFRAELGLEPSAEVGASSGRDNLDTVDCEADRPSRPSSPLHDALGIGAETENRHADPFGEEEQRTSKQPDARKIRRQRGTL